MFLTHMYIMASTVKYTLV